SPYTTLFRSPGLRGQNPRTFNCWFPGAKSPDFLVPQGFRGGSLVPLFQPYRSSDPLCSLSVPTCSQIPGELKGKERGKGVVGPLSPPFPRVFPIGWEH